MAVAVAPTPASAWLVTRPVMLTISHTAMATSTPPTRRAVECHVPKRAGECGAANELLGGPESDPTAPS
jgi:hypothetical protein